MKVLIGIVGIAMNEDEVHKYNIPSMVYDVTLYYSEKHKAYVFNESVLRKILSDEQINEILESPECLSVMEI